MESDFFKLSKEVANRFIQSVVFIDDRAFQVDAVGNTNAFDSNIISSVFAESEKICAIYAPKTTLDIKTYYPILNKTDVVILDWRLELANNPGEVLDPEADAEFDDHRGKYTIEIIKDLLKDDSDKKLKLIVIYTGDDIAVVKEEIIKAFSSFHFTEQNFSMQINNVRIVVRGKGEYNDNQYNHNKVLKGFVVPYQELPNLILDEFTKMSSGLVSNYALESATLIRENTAKILGVFSPDLDPAYLGHRLLLENSSDAKNLLTKLYGEVITELIESEKINTDKWVDHWLSHNIENRTIKFGSSELPISNDSLTAILNSTGKLNERIQAATKVSPAKKDIIKYISHLFQYGEVNVDDSNIKFAQLTHHKNVIRPVKFAPILTLGTIIKYQKDDKAAYYICIQQRCDSIRIPNNDNEKKDRRFLFLPLSLDPKESNPEGPKSSPIVIDKDTIMHVCDQSYGIKTIRFKSDESLMVMAKKQDDKWVFESIHGETFEWIIDLKDLHAQRIVNNYCAQLSRVGLNESEWLRLYK